MRGALLVVVGIAAGFLLGRATSDTPGAPRAASGRAASVEEAPPGVGASRGAPRPPGEQAALPAVTGTVRSAPPEGGLAEDAGRIEVRFAEEREAPDTFLHTRRASGAPFDLEFGLGETEWIRVVGVRAGTHLVWWREPEGCRRIGFAVRVEPGSVACVEASQGRELPPLDGRGQLLVIVAGADGLPRQGAAVRLEVATPIDSEEVSEESGADGRCLFEVVPGRHSLAIGAWSRAVQVAAGDTVEVAFRPLEHGSLTIELPERIRLAFAQSASGEILGSDVRSGTRHTFLALEPGEVEVFVADTGFEGRRPAGRFVVRAGSETTRHVPLPRGSLSVEVRGEAGTVAVQLAPTPAMPWDVYERAVPSGGAEVAPRCVARFRFLPPGDYVVSVRTRHRTVAERATVGDGEVTLSVDLYQR